MTGSLRFILDASEWRRKARFGLWGASGVLLFLMIADSAGALVQFFYPLAFGAPRRASLTSLKDLAQAPPYERFESAFARRSLFEAPSAQPETTPGATLASELAHLELTGILVGREKRVIFRDRNTQESFSVKEGGSEGNLTVKEIRSRSAVLAMDHEEAEIFIKE